MTVPDAERISPSGIKSFLQCERRWAFKYIAGRSEPPSKYTAFGTAFHKLAEDWLKTKALPPIDSLKPKSVETRAAITLHAAHRHMPAPDHPGLEVEKHFQRTSAGGVTYHGYVDVGCPDSVGFEPATRFGKNTWGKTPIIGDWKTTSDTKWALTEPELARDEQFTIYAWNAAETYDADQVFGNWVYGVRGERIAMPVRVTVSREKLRERIQELDAVGQIMLDHRKHLTVLQINTLPHGAPHACSAYGTVCPHIDVCHVKPEERMILDKGKGPKNMTSALDAILNGSAVPPPSVVSSGTASSPLMAFVAPTPLPTVMPAPSGIVAPWAGAAINPPPAPVAPSPPVAQPVQQTAPALPQAPPGYRFEMTPGGQVILVAEPAPAPVAAPPAAPEPVPPMPLPDVAAAATVVAEAPAGAPRKRGRPRKTEFASEPGACAVPSPSTIVTLTGPAAETFINNARALEGGAVAASTPTANTSAPAAAPVALPPTTDNAFTLYINSFPTKTTARVIPVAELLTDVAAAVCADTNEVHYRAVGFGKGPALLAHYLGQKLAAIPLGADVAVVVDTRTQEGADVCPTLERLAGTVVRSL